MSDKPMNWFPTGRQVIVQGRVKPEVANAKVKKPKYDMIEDYEYFAMRLGPDVPEGINEGDKIWTIHYNLEPIPEFGSVKDEVIYCVLDYQLIRLVQPGAYQID